MPILNEKKPKKKTQPTKQQYIPGVAHYFPPEVIADGCYDCTGQKVIVDNGKTIGYGINGKQVKDVTSKQCFAYKTEFTDATKNTYYIATDRYGGIFSPSKSSTLHGRESYIPCNKNQFEVYLQVLRSGLTHPLNELRDQLKTR